MWLKVKTMRVVTFAAIETQLQFDQNLEWDNFLQLYYSFHSTSPARSAEKLIKQHFLPSVRICFLKNNFSCCYCRNTYNPFTTSSSFKTFLVSKFHFKFISRRTWAFAFTKKTFKLRSILRWSRAQNFPIPSCPDSWSTRITLVFSSRKNRIRSSNGGSARKPSTKSPRKTSKIG